MGELTEGAPGSYLRVARAYASIEPDIREAVETIVGSLVGESLSKGLADAGASISEALNQLFGVKPQDGPVDEEERAEP